MERARDARIAQGLGTAIRLVPAHLTEEEAAKGDKISWEDWVGNTRAGEQAKDALMLHPDGRGRVEAIDRYGVLAVGAVMLGVAVYAQVVQDRDARGAPPPKRVRNRVPNPGRRKVRERPWEIRGHLICPTEESRWECDRCGCHAGTQQSLRDFANTQCHQGNVLTPRRFP